MVCALYQNDQNYYRAIVIKVEASKIMVKYVDYGNDETTTMENLFILPEYLKEVTLKNLKNFEPKN